MGWTHANQACTICLAEVCAVVSKWIRIPSLMVFFMSGSLSLVRELYGLYHGAIPASTIFWRCVWLAFVLSAIAVWIEDWWTSRFLQREVATLKLVPATLTVTPCELRNCGSTGSDIFLRAKVELLTPIDVAVDGYSVEISLNELIETPEVKSVAKWRLHDGTPSMPRSQPMAPLPASLRSGHPVEGWIHFLTTRSQYELESSHMTLFVHTSRGDGNVQFTPGRGYWLSSGQNFIMPDLQSE